MEYQVDVTRKPLENVDARCVIMASLGGNSERNSIATLARRSIFHDCIG